MAEFATQALVHGLAQHHGAGAGLAHLLHQGTPDQGERPGAGQHTAEHGRSGKEVLEQKDVGNSAEPQQQGSEQANEGRIRNDQHHITALAVAEAPQRRARKEAQTPQGFPHHTHAGCGTHGPAQSLHRKRQRLPLRGREHRHGPAPLAEAMGQITHQLGGGGGAGVEVLADQQQTIGRGHRGRPRASRLRSITFTTVIRS